MKILLWIIVIIVVVGGGYWLWKSRYSTTTTVPTSTPTDATSTDVQAANAVSIVNMSFSPAALTVAKGTTVTWTNNDTVGHTVTETDGQTGPASATVAPGKTYSFTFATAGTFKYHCSIHPTMTGTVVVTE